MKQMKKLLALALTGSLALSAAAKPEFEYPAHDRDRPLPPVVDPGETHASAPADAIVLFDGTDTDAWVSMDGQPTKWRIVDGALECVPQSGYARTLQAFGDREDAPGTARDAREDAG